MKPRRLILWFVAVITVLVAMALWFANKKPAGPPETTSVETNAAQSANIAASSPQANASHHINAPAAQINNGAANLSQSLPGNKAEQMIGILSTYNDVPIDFYGRVEDQFSNAVADAAVNFSVRVYNGTQSTVKRGQVTTDVNGQFTITGYRGESLGLVSEKAGYAMATRETFFKYSKLEEHPYLPDAANPTLIEMWKLRGAEHLIHFQSKIHVPLDGNSVMYDLQTGQQVQNGGDLVIRVESVSSPSVLEKYDWKAQIQTIGGGLIISSVDFDQMFEAPQMGYEPEFDISHPKASKAWSTTFNGVFYISTRNGGCYGKLGVEILSDVVKDGTTAVILNSYVNPNGSQNLEVDPTMVAAAHQ